jgi:propionate CoA-transferase
VDAIVCHDDTDQMAGYFHREPWSLIVPDGAGTIAEGLEQARVVRRLGELAGGFPRRTPVDVVLTRLAAATLADALPADAHVAIGTGLPETIAPELFESGRGRDFTFLVESGAVGGVPAQGVYFGAAFCPSELVSTAELFARCRRRLDAVCLGALEIDAAGDVNVSRRGRGVRSYIGPGGFIDFATWARTIVFVSHWMRGGEMRAEHGEIRIGKPGRVKLVRRVAERCFDAARALAAGKRIFYVTPVGVFRRGARGLELLRAAPGIDVRRDILAMAPFPIEVAEPLPLVDRAVLSAPHA